MDFLERLFVVTVYWAIVAIAGGLINTSNDISFWDYNSTVCLCGYLAVPVWFLFTAVVSGDLVDATFGEFVLIFLMLPLWPVAILVSNE